MLRALGVASLILAAAPAAAEDNRDPISTHPMGSGTCGTPAPRSGVGLIKPNHLASNVIFVDRCVGGCTFTGATTHDAKNDRVAIVGTNPGEVYTFDEFANSQQEIGAAADAEWNQIVDCVRKVYSYYDTEVTDVEPTSGTYHRAVVSGRGNQLIAGADASLLGISDIDCGGAIDNMSSFTFADSIRAFNPGSEAYVKEVCWTITHEAGHSFGLEHEFRFADNTSACNDPMSYDTGTCAPPHRFFRNKPALCGGFEEMPCFCSPQGQNSHVKITSVFGPGTPMIAPPIVDIVLPQPDQQLAPGSQLAVSAGHERGIELVEFYINGFKWGSQPGLPFVPRGGQPNPGTYQLPVPADLPDSIVDVQVKIYDDLGNVTESEVVTAVKGAACADASTCAPGQKCEEGRCFWDPPAGELGDSCTFPQFCLSGVCSGTAEEQICTQTCIPNVTDSCPMGFECAATSSSSGICFFPADGGGCCSTSDSSPWAPFGLAGVVLGVIVLRRRRR